MHRDLKRAQAEVKEAKATIARTETQAQELKKALKDAEKALRSEFPESAGVLDFVLVEEEAEDEKKVKTPRTRGSKGAKLSSEQVDRLLDGLTEPFTAEEFSKKADTMFPGLANKPIMKIAALTRVTLTPTSAAPMRFCAIARIALPSRVRLRNR